MSRRSAAAAVVLGLVLGAGALVPVASADPHAPATTSGYAAATAADGAAVVLAATGRAGRADRPPLRPGDVRFEDPAAPCATGPGRPFLRSATPTLHAVHRDRERDAVRAVVTVSELPPSGGTVRVFSARTTPQASGVSQAVPLRGLRHATAYRVRVHTEDTRGRRGPSVTCELEVDLVAPRPPSVTPVAVGSQPVYTAGVPTGGVGRPGSFVLGDGGSPDVVSYRYSLGTTALDMIAPGGSPTITVTPTEPGTNRLSVQSVDRAGWVSETVTYDLVVAFASTGRVTWKLDEVSGATAASTAQDGGDPFPLTLSPSVETRVGGFLADTAGSTTDRALLFDGGDDVASTSGPVVDTTDSFTVSAAVRPTSAVGTATAVSQDGTTASGFRLGFEPCADGVGSCWSFSVPSSDSAAAVPTTVLSGVGVDAGAWSEVTGVHDRDGGTLGLWVCHPTLDAFGGTAWTLTEAGTVPAPAPWAATGPFRLGRAAGSDPSLWSGAVGEARAAPGIPTLSALRRTCPPLG